jgi:cholesterol oxidase
MEQAMKELSNGVRGRYVTSILWHWPFRKLLTAHPLGGSFMGSDPRTSVVSHRGKVWGYPDLFVGDGSMIPSALSVNPSLTICALAERVAFWMLHGRDMGPRDPDRPATH